VHCIRLFVNLHPKDASHTHQDTQASLLIFLEMMWGRLGAVTHMIGLITVEWSGGRHSSALLHD
jgi:hypothetical protein